MAAVTLCSDFVAQKNKVSHCFPIYLPWSEGTRCHDLVFWMLSFKPTFSLSSFTFINRYYNFPGGSDGKESSCSVGDRFDPSVGQIPWRREWQPTLVFLPGEFHGQRSLAGYSQWGHKESDTIERLKLTLSTERKDWLSRTATVDMDIMEWVAVKYREVLGIGSN